MAQTFSRSANLWFKLAVLAVVLFVTSIALFGGMIYRSPLWTRAHVPLAQPVPFSHEHHVSGLGLDCRYCHTSVENSSFAGIPPTETCMTCHSQIWTNAPLLEPVRASYRENKPLHWTRVHDLPDFVYFDHSIHIAKGIGCATCHGRVDQMPITWKQQDLQMRWCLECHKDPGSYIQSHSLDAPVLSNAAMLTNDLARFHKTVPRADLEQLQNCSICHR
jgi:hypothetical protein